MLRWARGAWNLAIVPADYIPLWKVHTKVLLYCLDTIASLYIFWISWNWNCKHKDMIKCLIQLEFGVHNWTPATLHNGTWYLLFLQLCSFLSLEMCTNCMDFNCVPCVIWASDYCWCCGHVYQSDVLLLWVTIVIISSWKCMYVLWGMNCSLSLLHFFVMLDVIFEWNIEASILILRQQHVATRKRVLSP